MPCDDTDAPRNSYKSTINNRLFRPRRSPEEFITVVIFVPHGVAPGDSSSSAAAAATIVASRRHFGSRITVEAVQIRASHPPTANHGHHRLVPVPTVRYEREALDLHRYGRWCEVGFGEECDERREASGRCGA